MEPAIAPVSPANAEFKFKPLVGANPGLPPCRRHSPVVGMEVSYPAAAQLSFCRYAGIDHPLWTEIVTGPFRCAGPDKLRQTFQQLAKTGFARLECIFGMFPLGNIAQNDREELLPAGENL